MARRLVDAGFEVSGFDPVEEAAGAAAVGGVLVEDTVADAARTADMILLSLPSPAVDLEVTLGEGGVVEAVSPGSVIVDLSTVGPPTVIQVAAVAAARGVDFLDAPVSGGPVGADAGTLSLMAGGEPDVFDRCRPVLEVLASNAVLVGPVGAGQLMKLCNNLVAATILAVTSEAIVLGEKAGLDRETIMHVLGNSTGASWSLEHLIHPALTDPERDFVFRTSGLLKDVTLAVEAATAAGAEVPLGAAVVELLQAMAAAGFAENDIARMVNYYRR